MGRWISLLVVVLLLSCRREKEALYFTPVKAVKYFREVDSLCKKDGGKLWGKDLYGPLMFIDRPSRKIFANQPDKEGLLKEKDGIYTGVYPKERIINNIALDYRGLIYALAPLPPEEDKYQILTAAVHGLFHYFQKSTGIEPQRFNTKNMDEKEARLWLKLEWRALRRALNSEGEQKSLAIRDALIFRDTRREIFPQFINDENRFEDYEGLTTLTYTILCTSSLDEAKSKLLASLERIYNFQSYARSSGFISGGIYGYLAYEKGFDFKAIRCDSIDLGTMVKELYGIDLPAVSRDVAGSLALNYDVASIHKEEEKRLSDIKERRNKQLATFTEKPVVYLELESPYFDFEPEDIRSLDTLGTIYPAMRVSDNWGKLFVDKGGCLVSYNLKYLRITAKNFRESKNHYYGEGWHMILNRDWEVVKMDQNYFVRKLIP
jgi:hypothetical protein